MAYSLSRPNHSISIKMSNRISVVEMLTFEMSTAPVIYAKSEKDLTSDVIKEYDKKFSK